jgi:two-component system cell cycle sensor histidine kinase/response regulator CckA
VSTILLVDDDPIVRKIIGAILERSGFTVLVASDGEGALHALGGHAGEIGFLISDITMPGLSGLQLAALLSETRPNLRVLLISANEPPVDLQAGWLFLRKPFPPALLLETLAGFSLV